MQLHHLEMTAIGPYAGTERIDFSAVGRAGLFLLEGPTGSGKSTIIDAITFALYGKVAQASADVERIHSHHADPRTVPVVTLVFETQSGIYRVQRTPRFERPKSRGDGLTVQQPTIKLWRVATPDDLLGGELLSTTIGDCDDEITRAVGLTRDQFVQTVILPQGEFATFLRARSEDKGKLLEKVFGTAFFRRVQDEIVEAGRIAQARRQSAVDEIRMAVQAFAVSAGLETDRRDALVEVSRSAPEALTGELAQVVDELATRERHAGKRSREAIEGHRQMADMVGEARLRMQRRERLLALQREDETLGKRAVHFTELRAEVERARQAKPVVGAVRTLAISEGALKRAEAALKVARSRVDESLRDADLETLRTTATWSREVIGSLAGAITLETALSGRVTEVQRQQAELVRSRAALATTARELAALPRGDHRARRGPHRGPAPARPAREPHRRGDPRPDGARRGPRPRCGSSPGARARARHVRLPRSRTRRRARPGPTAAGPHRRHRRRARSRAGRGRAMPGLWIAGAPDARPSDP